MVIELVKDVLDDLYFGDGGYCVFEFFKVGVVFGGKVDV